MHCHNPAPNSLRGRRAAVTALIGACTNCLMAVLKIAFGYYGRSHALFADGIHSFADLATDVLVMVASYYASQDADRDHPYGHGRIETAATVFLAMLVIISGVGIFYEGLSDVFQGSFKQPERIVLAIAALSVALNECLYRYTCAVANKIDSDLLHANAWHHRSDALSSLVVFGGVLGSLFGIVYLDALAALLVALLIIRMGWRLGWSSIRELIDTGLPPEALAEIETVIRDVPGVVALHQLRTRSMRNKIYLDVHIQVAPKISVSEGHHIAEQVHYYLLQQIEHVVDVTVHVDPEDDEADYRSIKLPARETLRELLLQHWQHIPASRAIKRLQFHYLQGHIHLEIYIPAGHLTSASDVTILQQQFKSAISDVVQVGDVSVYLIAE